jgi:hypothetical protein
MQKVFAGLKKNFFSSKLVLMYIMLCLFALKGILCLMLRLEMRLKCSDFSRQLKSGLIIIFVGDELAIEGFSASNIGLRDNFLFGDDSRFGRQFRL